jgi:thiamine kinase-like enzyme
MFQLLWNISLSAGIGGKMFEKNHVEQVVIGEKRYIKKKLLKDIDIEMCLSKKKFVDFLIEAAILTARIIGYEECDGRIIETQEYIEIKNKIYDLKDYIHLVAKFHSVSRCYKGSIIQKNVLHDSVEIESNFLEQTLIGFEEKYYLYARKCMNESNQNNDVKNSIIGMHEKIYKAFIENFGAKKCIIHNDLTPNNIIMNDNLYLIDFDFAIKSFEYVDVVDIIFSRNLEIYDYLNYMRDDLYLNICVNNYNKFNSDEPICVHGVKLMAALKIYTYVMYIFSRNNIISSELCSYLLSVGKEAIEC